MFHVTVLGVGSLRSRRVSGPRLNPGSRLFLYGSLAAAIGFVSAGCTGNDSPSLPQGPIGPGFQQVNLVANRAAVGGAGAQIDTNLVNPWGISFSPGHPFWISNNHSGTSTLYDGAGVPQPAAHPLIVAVPGPGAVGTGSPSGTVFNPTTDFVIPSGAGGPALFLFATEDGTIYAWNGSAGRTAVQAVDNSTATGAVYKGLALSSNAGANFLYATDFHNGRVDVFDRTFQRQPAASFPFNDPAIPTGFAPFGIANVGDGLVVTYAHQDAAQHDDVRGPGSGYVDVFSPAGVLLQRFAHSSALNSPWGIVLAPASFGAFAGSMLIGNFGDGKINAFNSATGALLGPLTGPNGVPISIDGLWAIAVGGPANADPNALYFTAGPNGEADGLLGKLQVVPGTRGK